MSQSATDMSVALFCSMNEWQFVPFFEKWIKLVTKDVYVKSKKNTGFFGDMEFVFLTVFLFLFCFVSYFLMLISIIYFIIVIFSEEIYSPVSKWEHWSFSIAHIWQKWRESRARQCLLCYGCVGPGTGVQVRLCH